VGRGILGVVGLPAWRNRHCRQIGWRTTAGSLSSEKGRLAAIVWVGRMYLVSEESVFAMKSTVCPCCSERLPNRRSVGEESGLV
jgi:hypothetical protein